MLPCTAPRIQTIFDTKLSRIVFNGKILSMVLYMAKKGKNTIEGVTHGNRKKQKRKTMFSLICQWAFILCTWFLFYMYYNIIIMML